MNTYENYFVVDVGRIASARIILEGCSCHYKREIIDDPFLWQKEAEILEER